MYPEALALARCRLLPEDPRAMAVLQQAHEAAATAASKLRLPPAEPPTVSAVGDTNSRTQVAAGGGAAPAEPQPSAAPAHGGGGGADGEASGGSAASDTAPARIRPQEGQPGLLPGSPPGAEVGDSAEGNDRAEQATGLEGQPRTVGQYQGSGEGTEPDGGGSRRHHPEVAGGEGQAGSPPDAASSSAPLRPERAVALAAAQRPAQRLAAPEALALQWLAAGQPVRAAQALRLRGTASALLTSARLCVQVLASTRAEQVGAKRDVWACAVW